MKNYYKLELELERELGLEFGLDLAKLRLRSIYLSQRRLGLLFESMYVNPKTGFSRRVNMPELEELNINFRTTNGGGWCRGDDAGYLGKKYNVVRFKDDNGRIIGVRTTGFKTE